MDPRTKNPPCRRGRPPAGCRSNAPGDHLLRGARPPGDPDVRDAFLLPREGRLSRRARGGGDGDRLPGGVRLREGAACRGAPLRDGRPAHDRARLRAQYCRGRLGVRGRGAGPMREGFVPVGESGRAGDSRRGDGLRQGPDGGGEGLPGDRRRDDGPPFVPAARRQGVPRPPQDALHVTTAGRRTRPPTRSRGSTPSTASCSCSTASPSCGSSFRRRSASTGSSRKGGRRPTSSRTGRRPISTCGARTRTRRARRWPA